jgi:hypothetical protein
MDDLDVMPADDVYRRAVKNRRHAFTDLDETAGHVTQREADLRLAEHREIEKGATHG